MQFKFFAKRTNRTGKQKEAIWKSTISEGGIIIIKKILQETAHLKLQ